MAAPQTIVDVRAQDISRLRERALSCMTAEVRRDTDRISHLRAQVRALSPQNTLDRGYAVVQLDDGAVVRQAASVPEAAPLRIRVAVGELTATAGAPATAPPVEKTEA